MTARRWSAGSDARPPSRQRASSCRTARSSSGSSGEAGPAAGRSAPGGGLQGHLRAGAAAAKLIVADVGGYPEQPGAKAAAPEPGDGAEGGDERLLGGVLRRLRGAQHAQAGGVDLARVGACP